MQMNKVLILVVLPLAAFAAEPTITGVTAQQRYPWNGKVDITYTVTGVDIAEEAKQKSLITSFKATATDKVANKTYTAAKLSGDCTFTLGTHKFVWDLDAEGLSFKSTNVVFEVFCEIETTPAMYCVIDLSDGSNASSYPVSYLASPPSGGFNIDVYKTTKLVLRRIEAGSFKMGGSYDVTLTKPFFCGLFEVTEKQYMLVTGENPSYSPGDKRPVDNVNYNSIRGASEGAKWPSSSAVDSTSFLGKLRARTGLDFDLPTEAQWEYACRAGTTTAYSYGDAVDGSYMWYFDNGDLETHEVGLKLPNPWGLYDMHGNVFEWCLDWYNDSLTSGGTDPKGPDSGSTKRVVRGGYCWKGGWGGNSANSAYLCRSSTRSAERPNLSSHKGYGFRIVRTLTN